MATANPLKFLDTLSDEVLITLSKDLLQFVMIRCDGIAPDNKPTREAVYIAILSTIMALQLRNICEDYSPRHARKIWRQMKKSIVSMVNGASF